MRTLRIGIDGFNLALPRGGGIATYGSTLAHVLGAAGHVVEGVFGVAVGRDPARRGNRLVEAVAASVPPSAGRLRETLLHLKAALPGVSLRMRAVPEFVVPEGRLRAFARLTSGADLFPIAERHFNLYRRFLPLRMEDPPEIMHWTYPLSLML